MIKQLSLALILILLLVGVVEALPPAPGGGHVVSPSAPFYTLTVSKSGTGLGTVTAAGITCGADCDESYSQNVTVFLFATPTSGSTFAGWGGACSGTGSCSVTMTGVKSVTATFTLSTVVADLFAGPPGASPGGSTGACTSATSSSAATGPCDVVRTLQLASCGQTIQINNGTYSGGRYLLDLYNFVPGKSCAAGNEITVRAETAGQVVIDGQWLGENGIGNVSLQTNSNSGWIFQDFDIIRSGIFVSGSNNNYFQRICASNMHTVPIGAAGTAFNTHVLETTNGSTGNLFEDICVFGAARNMLLSDFSSPGVSNTWRRIWARHEGYAGYGVCDVGPAFQFGYHDNEPYNSVIENVITIHDQRNVTPSHGCYCPTSSCASGAAPIITGYNYAHTMQGVIAYSYTNAPMALDSGMLIRMEFGTMTCPTTDPGPFVFRDLFIDVSNQPNAFPFRVTDVNPTCSITVDRATGIRSSSGATSSFDADATVTNWHDCTTLGTCPDFYTGNGSGGALGARNCLQYSDGILTSTKLWPWPMDDRIKAALAREFAAGRGGNPLSGSAGTGYAANTVTSEIVSRYGAIPAACLR